MKLYLVKKYDQVEFSKFECKRIFKHGFEKSISGIKLYDIAYEKDDADYAVFSKKEDAVAFYEKLCAGCQKPSIHDGYVCKLMYFDAVDICDIVVDDGDIDDDNNCRIDNGEQYRFCPVDAYEWGNEFSDWFCPDYEVKEDEEEEEEEDDE